MGVIRASGIVLVGLMALVAVGCDLLGVVEEGYVPDDYAYASNVVAVGSSISGSVTWDPGKVYYIADGTSVESGSSLTIPPGTIVKFGTYGSLTVYDGANLIAGGVGDPVIFTSIRDTRGGDSITNDATTPPAKGDWRYLWVIGSGDFLNCEFAYAGKAVDEAALEIDGTATVDDCVFHDNKGGNPINGGYAALDASDAASATAILNCVFYNNDWAVAVNPGLTLSESNVFEYDPDGADLMPTMYNNRQAVFMADGSIDEADEFLVTSVPYVTTASFYISAGGSLTVADGVTVKFVDGFSAQIYISDGASFTYSAAVFTEYRDDEHGGDTNADDDDTQPEAGSWDGIFDWDAGDYIIDAAHIFYAANE